MRTLFMLAVLMIIPASFIFPQSPTTDAVWQTARVDRTTNNVIVFWLGSGEARRPVTVSQPYGMMLVWKEIQENFYLLDNVKKRMLITVDYDRFLTAVDHLPRGAAIEHPDVCTVPLDARMPGAERERLRAVLTRKKNRISAARPPSTAPASPA